MMEVLGAALAAGAVAGTDPFTKLITSAQLSPEILARARRLAAEAGERLPMTLTRLGLVSEHDMAEAFAEAYGFAGLAAATPARAVMIPRTRRAVAMPQRAA